MRQNPEVEKRYFTNRIVSSSGLVTESVQSYDRWRREYTSQKTPGYWSKVASKQRLPMNPYTLSIERRMGGEVYMETRYAADDSLYSSEHTDAAKAFPVFPLAAVPGTTRAEATATAAKRLREKLQGAKVNLAQAWAERSQTANMFADTATRVARAADAMRRANFKDFMHALSLPSSMRTPVRKGFRDVERTPPSLRLANHWLEYSFGWVPLLSDVHDAAELLAEQAYYNYPRGQYKSRASVSWKGYTYEEDGYYGGFRSAYTTSYVSRVKLSAKVALDSEAAYLLSKTGISNPALLAWELVPYSFVVDWFLPVGNYLEALNACDGLVITDIVQSTTEEATQVRDIRVYNQPGYYLRTSMSSATSRGVDFRYTRAPLTDIPLPKLEFRSPFDVKDQLTRFANAMGVLTQLFWKRNTHLD